MSHDFIYGYKPTPELLVAIKAAQLNSAPSPVHGLAYDIDAVLVDEVILARKFPEGYIPLRVGISIVEKVDKRVYFLVYAVPGAQTFTVVPQVNIDLADTQFSDVSQEVSMGRTIQGAIHSAFTNIDAPNINPAKAFLLMENAMVFGFQQETNNDTTDRQEFAIEGYGQALGRVSAEEVIDDSDIYDALSLHYVSVAVKKDS